LDPDGFLSAAPRLIRSVKTAATANEAKGERDRFERSHSSIQAFAAGFGSVFKGILDVKKW
jgi:hypothetical protein